MADADTHCAPIGGFGEVSGWEDGVPVSIAEFWTAKQRGGHSLHEISYRACFKPQLPGFFIRRFTSPGDLVHDPFMGRGTSLIEARLLGRRASGTDTNPIGSILTAPRLHPPTHAEVAERLESVELPSPGTWDEELLVFFHEDTLREIEGWRAYFLAREEAGNLDAVDAWIRMVACNRLTGHSPGFFSVYTLPPNQATSVRAQRRINARHQQAPSYRDTRRLILRKTRQLLRDPLPPGYANHHPILLRASADATSEIADESVQLVVTSPPFLNVVDYLGDNWMRMWFCGLDAPRESLWQAGGVDLWVERMGAVLREAARILKPGGHVAFEVGEVRKGTVLLERNVLEAARTASLDAEAILINSQNFTKTAHCWGVANNSGGTNTNRILLLRKPWPLSGRLLESPVFLKSDRLPGK